MQDSSSVTLPSAGSLYSRFIDRPVLGLVVHELSCQGDGPFGVNGRRDGSSAMVTVHPIAEDDDGALHFRQGRPLSPADHWRVLDALTDGARRGTPSGYIPGEVLYVSATSMTWYVPSVRHPMHFRVRGAAEVLTVQWPALVFHAEGAKLWVAALGDDTRPTPETPVYHAPLHNIYPNGAVCTGGATLPNEVRIDARSGWEQVIYDTAFSTVHTQNVLAGGADSDMLCDYWQARAADGRAPRADELMPTGQTLDQWRAAKLQGGQGQ